MKQHGFILPLSIVIAIAALLAGASLTFSVSMFLLGLSGHYVSKWMLQGFSIMAFLKAFLPLVAAVVMLEHRLIVHTRLTYGGLALLAVLLVWCYIAAFRPATRSTA